MAELVTDVTYRVKKVRGCSRKSQVVTFNNLQLYKRRQGGSMEEMGAREAVNAPQGGNGADEQVQTTLEGVLPMEPDTATSGTEEEVVWISAKSEGYNEAVDMPDKSASGDPSYLADSASDRAIKQGAGSDHVVGSDRNGEENKKDKHEAEKEQQIGQNQRPARVSRPPDRYGEWILNSLQQTTDWLKVLENKQRQDKEQIKKLKPKLLKKVRTLQEHCKYSNCFRTLLRDLINGLTLLHWEYSNRFKTLLRDLINGLTLFCFSPLNDCESGDPFFLVEGMV